MGKSRLSKRPPKMDECFASWTFNSQEHVHLPNLVVNESSFVDVSREDGSKKTVARWDLIRKALVNFHRVCTDNDGEDFCEEFKNTVDSYNIGWECSFEGLDDMVEQACQMWGTGEVMAVFGFMAKCCLEVEDMFPEDIRLLRGEAYGVEGLEFSKRQVLCLLANAFFCCYPERSHGKGAYAKYPRINFDCLFDMTVDVGFWARVQRWFAAVALKKANVAKLLCIFNYFRRMKKRFGKGDPDPSPGTVLFERHTLSPAETPKWSGYLRDAFCELVVHDKGTIEDSGGGLQVDFANKYVGGGTLGNGAAMEEIMFANSPELILSQLFTRELRDNECLNINGFERFSRGKGYLRGFRFSGDYYDVDGGQGNRATALDAARFKRHSLAMQLEKRWIDRELTKCFVAFRGEEHKVCSGKWGCGVFRGSPLLKCIIQWIACSVAGVHYLELYTFGDVDLKMQLNELSLVVQESGASVGEVYDLLFKFGEALQNSWLSTLVDENDLYDFILRDLRDESLLEEVKNRKVSRGRSGEGDMHRVIMEKRYKKRLCLNQVLQRRSVGLIFNGILKKRGLLIGLLAVVAVAYVLLKWTERTDFR